jgi:hypothetical protein
MEPIVTGRHRGQSNFVVEVIGYGDVQGTILLFNEIGRFRGETIAEEMPQAITYSPFKLTASGRSGSYADFFALVCDGIELAKLA